MSGILIVCINAGGNVPQPFVSRIRNPWPEDPRVITTAGTRITFQSGQHPVVLGTNYATTGAKFVIPNTISSYGGGPSINGELTGAYALAPVIVRASIQPTGSGTPTQLTFGGANSITIAEGVNAITDPLVAELPASGWLMRIEYTTTVNSQAVPTSTGAGERWRGVVGTDVLLDATMTDDSSSARVVQPIGVLGTPVSPSAKYLSHRFVEVGDSITESGTYFATMLTAIDTAFYWMAQAGHAALDWSLRPTEYAKGRGVILWNAPTMICNWGVNDIQRLRTAAQLITDITALAAAHEAAGGRRFIIGTITPITTSTDAWATTGNQTPSYGTNVSTYNAWARAVPTLGTLDVRVLECAAAVTDTNPDKWIGGMTDDGIHPNTTGYAAMSAAITTPATTAILADF